MATKLYLRDSNTSGAATGADAMHDLSKGPGAASTNYVKNTVTGPVTPPTAATQWTKTGGGTVCTWASAPLAGVTISGAVTFNLWAFESAAQANATITAELYRLDGAGAIVSTIAAATLNRAEMGTSTAARNWLPTVTARTLSTGDRLGVRVFMDDGTSVTMASGRTLTMATDGPTTGANGDSYVQVTEAIAFAYAAALSETMTYSETLASKLNAKVTDLVETITGPSESLASKLRAIVPLPETLGLAETIVAKTTAHPTLAETFGAIGETIAAHRGIVVALAESLGAIGESLASKYNAKPALPDSLAYSEAIATNARYKAALPDSLAYSEAVAASVHLHMALAESLGAIGESLASKLRATVALASPLTYGEALSVATLLRASLIESMTMTESLTAQLRAKAPLPDSLAYTEQLAAVMRAQIALADSLSSSEAVSAQLRAVVPLDDALALQEQLAAKVAAHIQLVDSLTIGEGVTGTQGSGSHIFLEETMDYSEAIAVVHGARAALAESLGAIGEQIAAASVQAAIVLVDLTIVESSDGDGPILNVIEIFQQALVLSVSEVSA